MEYSAVTSAALNYAGPQGSLFKSLGRVHEQNMLSPLPANPRDRIVEIGSILAVGLQRVRARKSSTLVAGTGESSLHIPAAKSGHEPENSPDWGRS
jgi:hypothetical protein